jgi:hypothetical protein
MEIRCAAETRGAWSSSTTSWTHCAPSTGRRSTAIRAATLSASAGEAHSRCIRAQIPPRPSQPLNQVIRGHLPCNCNTRGGQRVRDHQTSSRCNRVSGAREYRIPKTADDGRRAAQDRPACRFGEPRLGPKLHHGQLWLAMSLSLHATPYGAAGLDASAHRRSRHPCRPAGCDGDRRPGADRFLSQACAWAIRP